MSEKVNTSQRILDLIFDKGSASVPELAEDLQLSPVGIRRHISDLELRHKVEQLPAEQITKHSNHPGRPSRKYRLTSETCEIYSNNYKSLCKNIFSYLQESGSSEHIYEIGRRQIESLLAASTVDSEKKIKVNELINIFKSAGYASSIEEREGLVIINHSNCPLAALATDFPEVCQGEIDLLGNLLDSKLVEKIPANDKSPTCTVKLQRKKDIKVS